MNKNFYAIYATGKNTYYLETLCILEDSQMAFKLYDNLLNLVHTDIIFLYDGFDIIRYIGEEILKNNSYSTYNIDEEILNFLISR